MPGGEFQFDIDAPDLRRFLEHVKAFDPKLATAVRRQLRESGAEIIAEQRAILAKSKPGSIRVSSREYRLIIPRNGRRPYLAKRNVYETGEGTTGGIADLRARISKGLRTRVVAGKTRQAVSVKTTGPRDGGYNMAVVWQKGIFRHPVFGDTNHWVYQQGQPYFYSPVLHHYVQVRQRIADIIDEALARLAQK